MEWVVSTTPRPLYPRESPGTHCTGGWVDPRAGLEGAENLAATGMRFPDRPARNEWLYRLSYPCRHRATRIHCKRTTGPVLRTLSAGFRQWALSIKQHCPNFRTPPIILGNRNGTVNISVYFIRIYTDWITDCSAEE